MIKEKKIAPGPHNRYKRYNVRIPPPPCGPGEAVIQAFQEISVKIKTSPGFDQRLITVGQVKQELANVLNVLIHGFDLVQGKNVLQDSASADAYFGIMKPVEVIYRSGYGPHANVAVTSPFAGNSTPVLIQPTLAIKPIHPGNSHTNINVVMA